ncbi:hypothetical protein HZB88_00550, partial [archaeon]|nr:hypothetical protein [archaeon]
GIEEILKLQNITYSKTKEEYKEGSSSAFKSLTFSGAGEQIIGMQVPTYSNIKSIDMDISAKITNLSIDFGNEGSIDWHYNGQFLNWTFSPKYGLSLDATSEAYGYIIANKSYYCELIDLQFSKHYNISAKYEAIEDSGDIWATILSVPSGNPEDGWAGSANSCNLLELAGEAEAGSCTIEMDYPIGGKHLVCIYSLTSPNETARLYKLPIDTSDKSATAFTCPRKTGGLCTNAGYMDFFIYADSAVYNKSISGQVDFKEHYSAPNLPEFALMYYAGSEYGLIVYEGVCVSEQCNIPVKFIAASSGTVNLSNLELVYEYNGVELFSNSFYDIALSSAGIYQISNKNLSREGFLLNVSLQAFNITLAAGNYTLLLQFAGLSEEIPVAIFQEEPIPKITEIIGQFIEEQEKIMDVERSSALLPLLGINADDKIATAEGYKMQIGMFSEEEILQQIEALKAQTIKSLRLIKKVSGTQVSASFPAEMQGIALEDVKQEIKAYYFTITYYDNTEEDYMLIEKSISSEEGINELYVYDNIKGVDLSQAISKERASIDDGMLKWHFSSLNKGVSEEIIYLIPRHIDANDIKTFAIGETVYVCGNGVCEPSENENNCPQDCKKKDKSILIIAILIISITIILIFVYILLSGKNPRIIKPSPYKSPYEMKSTMRHINLHRRIGTEDKNIKENLRRQGHTDEQIKFAFAEAEEQAKQKQAGAKTKCLVYMQKLKAGLWIRYLQERF